MKKPYQSLYINNVKNLPRAFDQSIDKWEGLLYSMQHPNRVKTKADILTFTRSMSSYCGFCENLHTPVKHHPVKMKMICLCPVVDFCNEVLGRKSAIADAVAKGFNTPEEGNEMLIELAEEVLEYLGAKPKEDDND